ncbi:MAG: hypothetical protein J6N76_07665 [Lachnospiraceae bacterium]|nr:hypothetical protein [Lachnospiraceae bacterium]
MNTLESTIQLEKSAYVFVSSKETKLSKNESTEINVDQAKNMLDEAIESMPPLRKMTREVATEKIDDWKKARLYWDAIKDNDAVTKEDKNKYEDYVKRFDALEDYLDKYSTLIQHPGFVKLSMEGYSLPKNGTIEPEKDYSEYSAYSKNNSEAMSKDVFEALGLMRNLTSQWSTLIGSQEDEINAVREEYFNSKEDESNKTDQQRAAEGLKKGHAYSMILEKKLTEHRLKNNVKLSFNQRVITATVSSLSVLEGISLDECKEMELNLATKCEEVLQIKDKDKKKEQLEKKAKTIEKIFDAVMKIDFNTIHLDDEKLLENAALSEIKTSFGMEVGYVLDEYLKIPKEEGINLKYDEEKIKILKARYETLTDLATAYNTKLYSKALDFGQTEEGKKLMTMDPIKFMTEKVKRGKDSSNAEWFYIQRIMNYKAMQMRNGGADPTVKGSLQESMDKYHINSID